MLICEDSAARHHVVIKIRTARESSLPARASQSAATRSRIFEKIGVACPKCGGDLVLKKSRKRQKIFTLR